MSDSATVSLAPGGHFLIGGGEMGEAVRQKDWAATPLGAIDKWPQSLRIAVSLCVASDFPINLIWGPDRIQIYNDGYRPLCGAKHPNSLGEDYRKTWASAWDSLGDVFDRALAGQAAQLKNERLFLDRNGYLEETFFTLSLSPIRDESGQVGGLFHPATETTAAILGSRRTRALQELGSQTGRSKTVLDACELATAALASCQFDLPFVLLYLVDEDGKQARLAASSHLRAGSAASPAKLRMDDSSGWPVAEMLRAGAAYTVRNLRDRFGPIDSGPYPESAEAAVMVPIMVAGLEKPAGFLVAGISPRLLLTPEYQAFVECVGAGLSGAIVNARTAEEERTRAEKVAALDRAKTVFLSSVSHEFRTPLTLMLGPLEEMLAQPNERVTASRIAVDLIHRNGLRLLRLVNTLLDLSRIEANRTQAAYESTDLAALTQDLASLFRFAIEKAGLSLVVDCPPLSEPIYVDRDMWEKIVLNILSNAFKFTFYGGIRVRLADAGTEVLLSITDTGTGIPEHELPHVFERFHRAQGAKARTDEGTGIGLALVEDLVKVHGGRVSVQSAVGAGTTFDVAIPKGCNHLPMEQVRGSSRNDGHTSPTANALREEAFRWLPLKDQATSHKQAARKSDVGADRIVLAENNADMRQYIENILTPEYDVQTANDGAQALQMIQNRAPDLVLTDVRMPELDGFGLLKALRADKNTHGIPVIMLSARAGEQAGAESIDAGADDYLLKPFNARELAARVRMNLELAHLRQELSREEQRRSSTEVERQWRLFDTALSHTPDSIYIFDLSGRVVYANQALLQRWRKSYSHVIGKTLVELGYPPEAAAKIDAQMQRVLEGRRSLHDEMSLPDENGTVQDLDYVFVPVFAATGEVEALAGSSRNITAFRETNRALLRANADLQQFAYSASHDLQEPLRMVAVFSQLLKKKYAGALDSQADAIIAQCVNGAVRMGLMIDDLLTYTQASVAQQPTDVLVSANAVFDTVLSSLQIAIAENAGSVLRGELPDLRMEPVHLRQIFQNLVSNALKYRSQQAPVIAVAAERQLYAWVISVADNGIGIAPEYRDQIFGLFKRLHTRERYSGTGLGLAICKKLVEHYQGRIWVESEPGRGSTFFFSLPVEEAKSEPTNMTGGKSEWLLQ